MAITVPQYVYHANGQGFVPVACDMVPTRTTQDYYMKPYRDLSGQSGASPEIPGYVEDLATTAPIVISTSLAGTQVKVTAPATPLVSGADDVWHVPWRQDAPFKEDVWVFTDSGGNKVGVFPAAIYPAYGNQRPNRTPS